MVLNSFEPRIDLTIVIGGQTRFNSVKNGLSAVPKDAIVMVHDGVRPLVSKKLIQRCIENTLEFGNAIPAILVTDSIRIITNDSSTPINREQLRIIQTPQTFKSDILLKAFEQEFNDAFTDEATVVESIGIKVSLVAGDKSNIKITNPEDLVIAEVILKEKTGIKVV
jgi:2-C-methyl-D-erythritol 4-phosphate cytidylyltransferase